MFLSLDRLAHPLNVGFEILQTKQRTRLLIPAGAQHAETQPHQAEKKKEARTCQGQSRRNVSDALGDQQIAANKHAHAGDSRQTCEHRHTTGHPVSDITGNGLLANGWIVDVAFGHTLFGTLGLKGK